MGNSHFLQVFYIARQRSTNKMAADTNYRCSALTALAGYSLPYRKTHESLNYKYTQRFFLPGAHTLSSRTRTASARLNVMSWVPTYMYR